MNSCHTPVTFHFHSISIPRQANLIFHSNYTVGSCCVWRHRIGRCCRSLELSERRSRSRTCLSRMASERRRDIPLMWTLSRQGEGPCSRPRPRAAGVLSEVRRVLVQTELPRVTYALCSALSSLVTFRVPYSIQFTMCL